jgi:hypothetical protein
MTNQMVDYKADLNQRYWEYQKSQFPVWQKFFDRPHAERIRPPVFDGAGQNVIVKPNASQQEIDALFALLPESDRHKWFRSMNSSQALAQSVLGNLAIYGFLNNLAELLDDDSRMPLLGKAQVLSDNFKMEFKIDYLGEHHSRRTSLDGYLGGDYRVAIECKFTESEVGTCSKPGFKPADSNYCNGSYTRQRARKERCTLSEIGALYWKYIPRLFHWKSDVDLDPCPLNKNYQLVRNILAVGVKPDGEKPDEQVSSANGHVVLIYDERNPAFQKDGKGLAAFEETRRSLQEPTMLRKCSWQCIVQRMRNKGILDWLTEELKLKYGM